MAHQCGVEGDEAERDQPGAHAEHIPRRGRSTSNANTTVKTIAVIRVRNRMAFVSFWKTRALPP